MRYLHNTIDDLIDFVRSNQLEIIIADLWGRNIRTGQLQDIRTYFEPSQDVISNDTHEYIFVGKSGGLHPAGVQNAIQYVEKECGEFEFVIHAYPDGGVISYSNENMSFQNSSAVLANWWKIEDMKLSNSDPNPWRIDSIFGRFMDHFFKRN